MSLLLALAALALQLPSDPAHQIAWQRSLADARAVAAAEERPLLVAVNMDGESASERIVREQYKDEAFVDSTRSFACLVSSVFRHTPRDRDVHGARIECPRLGRVTCGEHVALEPVLWDAFLGGERIAPRHALIPSDGEKRFDLFLLFDLGEIERALVDARPLAPPPSPATDLEALAKRALPELVAARDDASRAALERFLATSADAAGRSPGREALALIAERGDAGSIDALALLLLRERALWSGGRRPLAQWEASVRALGLESEAAALVRDALGVPSADALAPGLGDDAELIGLLARLASDDVAQRTLVLSYLVLPNAAPERAHALSGLAAALGWQRAQPALAAAGSLDLGALLAALRAPPASVAEASSDVLSTEVELEERLARLDEELAAEPASAALAREAGLTALGLARRRAERGDASTPLLVEDAERWLARAFAADPADVEVALARARAAYMASRFEDQEQRAAEALAAAEETGAAGARIEALRWLGDGAARLSAVRSGEDLAVEAAGLARAGGALLQIVASGLAEPADWQAAASFFGSLGRWREETALARLGLERFPDDEPLHQALARSLFAAGFPARAAEQAAAVAWAHPRSATAAWFAGLAHVLHADWMRRGEAPERALLEYRRAAAFFELSRELEPAFGDTCEHYLALAALGRGFAHLAADRRGAAAEAMLEALALRRAIGDVRDGLDREALDLVDGALEWRASGPSPVEPLAFAGILEASEPSADEGGQPGRWARAVCDAELREALRSLGRADDLLGLEQLEAAGEAGRIALALDDSAESRHALAQPLAIQAELALADERVEDARAPLAEALELLALAPPASDEPDALREAAARAREALGDARPLARPGR